MNDQHRSLPDEGPPSPQRGRRPACADRPPANTPMRAVSRSRGQNRRACSTEGHRIVDEARGEVDELVDKMLPSQRKKAGRPRGKSNKYAGLPPCSTSSRLQENVASGNSNCRQSNDGGANRDTAALQSGAQGSRANIEPAVFPPAIPVAVPKSRATTRPAARASQRETGQRDRYIVKCFRTFSAEGTLHILRVHG